MTEAFSEWTKARIIYDDPPDDTCLNDETAHFWLSAFVKEITKRAQINSNLTCNENIGLGAAFCEIVEEFGLEEER